jgi:putative PIN family toxin of toxin-antitoxin system
VPRVVVDTNVLVSAALSPHGLTAAIVLALMTGDIEIVVSPELIAELEDVLARPKVRRRISREDAGAFVAALRSRATLIADPEPPAVPICDDPKDEYLVSLARVARVDALVSGDPHLLRLADRIPVVSPRGCVNRFVARET